ncbi:MAG: hypothetical protein WCB85_07280 [Candidatus Dormiibacterota bacterium]
MDREPKDSRVRRQFRGTGLYWALILALVVVVAIIVGLLQQSPDVRVKYLAWSLNMPLAVVLPITMVLIVALASLVGVIWRSRGRHQLNDSVGLLGQAQVPAMTLGGWRAIGGLDGDGCAHLATGWMSTVGALG